VERFHLGRAAVPALLLLAIGCTNPDTAKRAYLENGKRLAGEKRYTEAIGEYLNALQIDDKLGEARLQLADALAASGNPERAYREYQRAADLLPDRADVQKKAATFLFMAGQFEDVRTRVEAVLRKNPKDIEARLLYANALVGLRDLEGGVREIEEAVQLDPQHAATYTNLALLKMAQGQRQAAQEAFKKAVDLDPKSIQARLALAHFDMATGNLALAEESLKIALALDPKDALANRALAGVYVGTGRDALAEKPLQVVAEVTRSPRAKFALAEYYVRSRRIDDAKGVMEPMLKDASTFADAQARLAQLTYSLGDRPGGNKMLDEVLARQPNHSYALQVKARWLVLEGRPVQALERATTAVNASPRDVGALFLRGTLQAVNGQREGAVKSFNEVLRLNPRAAAAQVQLAQLNLERGEAEAAVGIASEAVSNAPTVAEARLVLARALVAQGDLVRAEIEIDRLLKLYPRASAVNALRGTLYLLKGNPAVARSAFQLAFDAEPGSIAALTGLTMLDVQEKRLAQARARVERRLEADVKRPRPALLLVAAKVYVQSGDLGSAERRLRQAIDLAPTTIEPYVLLGEIYRAQQRLEAARVELDKAVTANPGNVPARTMAAMLIHAQQRPAEAKRRYEELLNIEPQAAVAANNLAWIYAEEKQNLDEALLLAQRAVEQMAEFPEAWDTLGWVYFRKQLPILAVEPFERAISKAPGNATFHYHLGLALAGSGDRVRSRDAFEKALTLQPDFPDARRELTALDHQARP
jgi:putative PEP-CTERM system TPR-repeat lipoprotein